MKICKYPATLLLVLSMQVASAQKNDVIIRFNEPAKHFSSSLPLGNGRLGAMVFGDTKRERIALNEISLWSGGPQDADREDAFQYLKPIQDYLLEGKNKEAQALLQEHFVAKGRGSGEGKGANEKYGCYQTLGDLVLEWQDGDAAVTSYKRELDIESAIAITSYRKGGNMITEQVFADFGNDIVWIRIASAARGGINFKLSLYRQENATVNTTASSLIMQGQLPSGQAKGMRFAAIVEPVCREGRISQGSNTLSVENATECWIKISAATDFNWETGLPDGSDPVVSCKSFLSNVSKLSFADAAQKHSALYQRIFNRCRWRMPDNQRMGNRITSQRLNSYTNGGSDPQLPVLYFNFGRYLLISSSRPGLLPANLQGLWAVEYQTPWNGDYHLNINIQMNYWLAETGNLTDLAEPLFRFIGDLVPNGMKTAKAYYNADGWVAHVISNPWRFTSPGEGANWGSTLTGGAWLCEHIWEHYRFTGNREFLQKYYPVMKGAAKFLQSILIREPSHGWLVTAPSNSPEQAYVMPDGFTGNTCMGPTIDMQICREIFNACISASTILNADEDWRNELTKLLPQLAPLQIGKEGDINEWLADWKDGDPQHRHVSHLYGLHPYDEITPWQTPDLANAAKKTLTMRGDEGTGWSKAWKINFWARLGDGDHSLKLLRQLLKPVTDSGITMHGGGTYANLFCAHPPFQIDGNLGGAAGLAEMLLQSHGEKEVIRLLPALPTDDDWKEGSVTGLKARNGFEVDLTWRKGVPDSAVIRSVNGSVCRLLLPHGKRIVDNNGKQIIGRQAENIVVEFFTIAGASYKMI